MNTTTKKRKATGDGLGFNRPAKAPVISLDGTLKKAVISQLEDLLCLALRGDIVGLAYAAVDDSGEVSAGAAGSLGRDNLRAAGAFSRALYMCHSSTAE